MKAAAPGPSLPDSPRGGLSLQLKRQWMRGTVDAALSMAFRGLQPDNPQRFSQAPERNLLPRLYAESHDGWRCPLFRVEPPPGSTGEPLLLLHGLGLSRHSLDFDQERSLARGLAAAGYQVYMAENRADRSALPPAQTQPFDFDDIATADLPAALQAVREHSGYERVVVVGHGLGGQLLYAYLAHFGDAGIAAAITLGAAVRFQRPRSGRAALTLARTLLPASLRVPTSAGASLLSPAAGGLGSVEGERTRGLLLHGTEDLSGGMLRQALRWVESGSLVDRDDRLDYAHALAGVSIPLMLVCAHGDRMCPPAHAVPVQDTWSGPVELLQLDREWGHLDLVMGPRAGSELHPRLLDWLEPHRRACW
ncbi:MAG: alpha/beta fold hydrolase [Myxococcota bacterium]|nr:alpha/beta fold hydrolase [Myxococcota bacterium]